MLALVHCCHYNTVWLVGRKRGGEGGLGIVVLAYGALWSERFCCNFILSGPPALVSIACKYPLDRRCSFFLYKSALVVMRKCV